MLEQLIDKLIHEGKVKREDIDKEIEDLKAQQPKKHEEEIAIRDAQITELQERNAVMQEDQLFLMEETVRLNERDSQIQDDQLFMMEILEGL